MALTSGISLAATVHIGDTLPFARTVHTYVYMYLCVYIHAHALHCLALFLNHISILRNLHIAKKDLCSAAVRIIEVRLHL